VVSLLQIWWSIYSESGWSICPFFPAAQEKETSDIIQKIEGTEFLAMMQQSIDGASQKIARLLDKSLSEKHNVIPKENQNNALDNFDIGDFI